MLVTPCFSLFHAATATEERRKAGHNGGHNRDKREIEVEEELANKGSNLNKAVTQREEERKTEEMHSGQRRRATKVGREEARTP